MSINDNIKFSENIKHGFKRTISWNKYRSEITTQTKNNNLDYLIDLRSSNINRLFVLSFKNRNNDPTRNSFHKYYIPLVEIKDFNALIDNIFWSASIKQTRSIWKIVEMSRNDNFTTGNFLDYLYRQNYYKLIGIDLSRQKNTSIPQQIDFTGKLEEDYGVKMFFIAKKQQKIILNFSLYSLIVTE